MWVEGVETVFPITSILNENTIQEGIAREIPTDGFQPPDIHDAFDPILPG